ncbi:Uncharacterised protein [uncultured archaeon]|nr:Uncharacterised protein [uncultured archaeon]
MQATTATVNNAAPLAERLDSQHERTESAAGDAVSAAERAEEEVEAVVQAAPSVPTPEEDLYTRNVMGAAEEGRALVEEVNKETALADQITNTWGNISEDAVAVREAEAARMAEFAERTLESIETPIRNDPAAAPVVQVLEAERQNIAAAREMLTAGTAVAERDKEVLAQSIRQDTAQLVRWKEEVRPIALSMMALVSSIEQKKLPAPKLNEALIQLGTLEKRFIQVTESHGVDPKVFKDMLPAVRARLAQSAKTLAQVNGMFEASEKRLAAVPRALLAPPKEEPSKQAPADNASLAGISRLLSRSKELFEMVQAIERMREVRDPPSAAQTKLVAGAASLAGVWYADDVVSVRKMASAVMKGGMDDLAGILSPNYLGVLEKLPNHLASLSNAFQSERRRSQPLLTTLADFRAQQYSVQLMKLIQNLESVLQRLNPTA